MSISLTNAFAGLIIFTSVTHTISVPFAQIAELRESIRENYINVEPFLLTDRATRINASMGLMALTQFSEVNGELSSLVYLKLAWHDPQIQWDPSDFGGRHDIMLFPNEIWTPILTIVNQVDKLEGMGKGTIGGETFKVRIHHTGEVIWKPGAALTTTCSVDITYFPEDEQTCVIKLYAWSYIDEEIELVCADETMELLYYSPSGEWDMMDTSCSGKTFTLKIKRKPVYYFLNIILPVFVLGILNAFVFLIPANSGETFSFSVTIFLSLVVYLTIVSQQLPRTSDHVSLLSCYLVVDVIYSSCIIIMAIIIQRLQNAKNNATSVDRACAQFNANHTAKDRTDQHLTEETTSKRPLSGKNNRCIDNLGAIAFVVFLSLHFVFSIIFMACVKS